MFSDPQTVTVNAVAQSLAAISREGKKSVYAKADGSYILTLSHNVTNKRERYVSKLEHRKLVADPLTPANNVDVFMTAYLVIDNPITGFTDTEIGYDVAGLLAWLNSTNVGKLLGLES